MRAFLPDDFTFVPRDEIIYDQAIGGKPTGYFKDAMIRLGKNKMSVAALIVIVIIIILAAIGPGLTPYGYNDQDIKAIK